MAASLYLRPFSLRRSPFPVVPDGDAYFADGGRRGFVDAVLHVLRAEAGVVKITGAAGAGKTGLCRHLSRTLRDAFEVVYTCDPTPGPDAAAFVLADALGVDAPRGRPEEAAARVRAALLARRAAGRPVLLLVDEAQALPLATLERLRLVAQVDAGPDAMRLVLLGTDALDRALAAPGAEALRTRVAHALRLRPFAPADVDAYLAFRMRAAGGDARRAFSPNAARAIARLSRGVPRRIHLLADKALLAATLARRDLVRTADVATAARELKRMRSGAPRRGWTVGAAAFAAGVAATAAAGALALHAGWLTVPAGPGQRASAPAGAPSGLIAPASPASHALPAMPPPPSDAAIASADPARPRFAQDVVADRAPR